MIIDFDIISIATGVMKTRSEKEGLNAVESLRNDFREIIESTYESKAKDCLTCEVQGICCTDEHFVNVQITRLDAEAIGESLLKMSSNTYEKVISRNKTALRSLQNNPEATYSCPLFEPNIGCLVHETAKPFACINHACYESPDDLPPDELLETVESKLNKLNDRVYRSNWSWLPIPLWIERLNQKSSASHRASSSESIEK